MREAAGSNSLLHLRKKSKVRTSTRLEGFYKGVTIYLKNFFSFLFLLYLELLLLKNSTELV